QFMETRKDTVRRGNIAMSQEESERPAIYCGSKTGVRTKSFEFRAEEKIVVAPAIVQRFFTETIASQEKELSLNVDQSDSKHPNGAIQCGFQAPLTNSAQQYFGIRASQEVEPARFQFWAKVAVIVDFAVHGENEATVGRNHRLFTGFG